MARPLEPWQRGYIPPVKPRKRSDSLAPEAPPGWEFSAGDALNWRYTYSYPWKSDYAQLVGGPGKEWKLYRGSSYTQVHDSVFIEAKRSFAMASKCLKTVARWWAIEVSLMPEPTESDNPFADSYFSLTGRQIGKHAALGAMYGMGGKTALQIGNATHNALAGQLMQIDFKTVEARALTAMCERQSDVYRDLLKYCLADVTGGKKSWTTK